MRRMTAAALLLWLAPLPETALAACQTGVASAPYIGATDMRAIDRAAEALPTAADGVKVDVGSAVPASVKRTPVPAAVAKILPQYEGYLAFRTRRELMIVDPRGVLAYMMPLRGSANPANCP